MKVKNLFILLSLFSFTPVLAGCNTRKGNQQNVIYSYQLEANTEDIKTKYYAGELFDPTGLEVSLITFANGEKTKTELTTDYTFSIDINLPLNFSTKEIYLYASDENVLPAKIDLDIEIPVFGIGKQMNLAEQFPDYTFESDQPLIGRVKADGYLETYREGKFSLTGTHATKSPIFFECVVEENEEINYESYIAKGCKVGGTILEICTTKVLPTNSKFKMEPEYEGNKKIKVRYEFTNNDLIKTEVDPEFGSTFIVTNSNSGSTRIKIYLESTNKLLYDLYLRVSEPFTPYEIKDVIQGTHWLSYRLSGEAFTLNFIDSENATLSGLTSGSAIEPIDFTFEPRAKTVQLNEKTFAFFDCVGQNSTTKIKEMYIDVNLENIMLYNSNDGLISIFTLDLE